MPKTESGKEYNIAIFDWNGNTVEEVTKIDAAKFGFTAEHLAGEGLMGFELFKIEGPGVAAFLEYYGLELDDGGKGNV